MSSAYNKNVRRIKNQLVLWFSLIIFLSIAGMGILLSHRSEQAMEKNVQEMITHLNNQMVLTMDFYFDGIRENAIQVFSDKDNYLYDPLTTNLDDYDKLQMENKITSSLSSMSFTENYLDFGIVYADGKMLGRISNGTSDSYGASLYEQIEGMITNEETHDGWSVGKENDFKRIYYVKRLNEHAILVTSLYTVELEKVLVSPQDMDLTVFLTDENHLVLYSSQEEYTGTVLPESILKHVSGITNVNAVDEESLLSVRSAKNNWLLISSASTERMLSESRATRHYIILLALFLIVGTSFASNLITNHISEDVIERVNKLDELSQKDQLSDLLNKQSFRNWAEKYIQTSRKRDIFVMVFLDIDNFKMINDTRGHGFGDEVIQKFGYLIRNEFREEDLMGRIGGDEFGVFMRISASGIEEAGKMASGCCKRFLTSLHQAYENEEDSITITSSIGIAVEKADQADFDILFTRADEALYQSKENGKDRYTLYREVEHV